MFVYQTPMRSIFFVSLLFIVLNPDLIIGQEPDKNYSYDELLNLNIEQLLDLDVNVQVASTGQNNLFSSPSIVSIINRETIVNYNFQSVGEAIQIVSGIMMSRTYLKKNIPTARGLLQDHYANKILILIDGVPTFNAITGEGVLDRININNVERIEVLKGPASVLYGTNAYAGAINIVLRADSKSTVEAFAGLGLDNMYTAGMSGRAEKNKFNVYIAGNSQSIHNSQTQYTDENKVSGFIDDVDINQNFTLVSEYKSHKILLNTYNNQEGYLGVTGSFASGAGFPHNLNGYLLNYTFEKDLGEKLLMDLSLSDDFNKRLLSRTYNDSILSSIRGWRYNGLLQFNYKLNKNFDFDFGVLFDYRKSIEYTNFTSLNNQVISNNNLKDRDVIENSVFAQVQYRANRFSTVAGARYTYNKLAGKNISPRFSAVYDFNRTTSIKAIFGESFRAPTLFEQFFINPDSTVFGNEALLPEKSKSFEIALLKQIEHLFFQILAYHSWQYNKIQREVDDISFSAHNFENVNIYRNGNDYTAYGLESEIKYLNPRLFNVFLNYNFCSGSKTDERDSSGHYNFKYVPHHEYTFGLNKALRNGFFSSLILNGWSQTSGVSGIIPAQQTIDFTIGYKNTKPKYTLSHSVSAKNILNSRIEIPEYVRRNMNDIMLMDGINLMYTLRIVII